MDKITDNLNIIKMNLISIFSRDGELQSSIQSMNYRDVGIIFEFFKLSDELRDVWFTEWLTTIDRWDVLFTKSHAVFGYVSVGEELVVMKIDSVDVHELTIETPCANIPINLLPGTPLSQDDVEALVKKFPSAFDDLSAVVRLSHLID